MWGQNEPDDYSFHIASYEPSDVTQSQIYEGNINGVIITMKAGMNYIIPYFVLKDLRSQNQYTVSHEEDREATDRAGQMKYKTKKRFANFHATPVPEEYNSPDGVRKLLVESREVTDPKDPRYKLALGVNQIEFRRDNPFGLNGADQATKSAALRGDTERDSLKVALKESEERNAKLESSLDTMLSRLEALEKSSASSDDESDKPAKAKRGRKAAEKPVTDSAVAESDGPEEDQGPEPSDEPSEPTSSKEEVF